MKKILVSFLVLVCATAVGAVSPKSTVKTSPKVPAKAATKAAPAAHVVKFNGQKYILQYSMGNKQEWLNEYLPAGVTFANYTEMLTVRSYDGVKATPEQIGASIVTNLRQKYPDTPYNFVNGAYPGEVEVSFAIAEFSVTEFNLFRIVPGKDGHPVALQYVNRVLLPTPDNPKRQELVETFAATLQKNLNKWVKALRVLPVPEIVRTPNK